MGTPPSKVFLKKRYTKDLLSAAQIAAELRCSEHKIHYWLAKYSIPKREIAEAAYVRINGGSDPFTLTPPRSTRAWLLLGVGLGLYWGEGTKSNRNAVRLGNTDPRLIATFVDFLETYCGVQRKHLKFGLQVFSDMSSKEALCFWTSNLQVEPGQFYKVVRTKARGVGTYRKKTKHGVLTVYYHNTKLRNHLCAMIEELDKMY